ncbi:GNAT family N-acetyltransferase [Kribbella sp. NPDC058245]|uniref:GNAT family N-acetyltransferase n=1 Tax=Kribbella sp. NPDC058245 TaxID=3346399 RepID=UPI0036E2688A
MEINSLGYRTDLFLLGLGGSEISDTGPYVVIRTPANPTFWWGNYLLHRTPLEPGDLERRVTEFRAEFPAAKHVALGIDTTDGVLGIDPQEVIAAGGRADPSVVMTTSSVNAPKRPNTTSTFRFLDGDDDWQRVVDLTLATSTMTVDDGHREFTRLKVAHERELVEAGHGKWFGAFDGDRLQASLGLMLDGEGLARFQNVQTHPDDRNQGIASTLIHRASTYGFEQGAKTLVMVADPGYLAIHIYRTLGFNDTETQLAITIPPA